MSGIPKSYVKFLWLLFLALKTRFFLAKQKHAWIKFFQSNFSNLSKSEAGQNFMLVTITVLYIFFPKQLLNWESGERRDVL